MTPTTTTPTLPASASADLAELREQLDGAVAIPGEEAYDRLRASWNLASDQRPAIVVEAADSDDVVAALGYAHAHELTVCVQSTGHGAATCCDEGMLLRTGRLRGVAVDAERRTARVGAGARWVDVLPVAAPHGLAPLLGFNAHVGVTGYTLGGGLGWLGRRHGLAVDRVRALEVVLPDATRVRASAETHPDLFWALRGGASNFGVVVELELELVEAPALFGGMVLHPGERAADVLDAYAAWAAGVPEEVTSSCAVIRIPPLPEVPEPLRGRTVVGVGAVVLADPDRAQELLAPLRAGALGEPLADLMRPLAIEDLGSVAMDPVDPMPAAGHAELVRALTPEVRAIVAGAAVGEQPLAVVEVRHLGGAIGRPGPAPAGALARPDGEYLLHAEAVTPPGPGGEAALGALRALADAIAPHATGTMLPNFQGELRGGSERVAQAYEPAARRRLAELKRAVDPGQRFRFGRVVPLEWAEG